MPGGVMWLLFNDAVTLGTGGGSGSQTYEQAVLSLNPTGYWRLGEATGDAADTSGNSHTLTASGTPTYGATGWAAGDDAITFGASDVFYASDHADWDVGTNDFTVVWVMKHPAAWPVADHSTILGHDGQGNSGEWAIHMRGNVPDYLRLDLDTNSYDLLAGVDVLDDGSWHHVAWSVDRSGYARLHVDGSYVGQVDVSADVATDLTNASSLYLGAAYTDGTRQYEGDLDEVAFWNGTALTDQQVLNLYNARSGIGGGGGGDSFATVMAAKNATTWWRLGESGGTTATDEEAVQNGTYVASPTLSQSGFTDDGDTAVLLDGSTQRISLVDNAAWDVGTSDFSFMACAYVASWPTGGAHGTLFMRDSGYGIGDFGLILNGWAADYVSLFIYAGHPTAPIEESFVGSGLAGGWHMYSVSVDRDDKAYVYLDGSLLGSVDVSGLSAVNMANVYGAGIGAKINEAWYLDGTIDEVAFWNGTALTAQDWSDIYAARNA